jgi:hypothetical protein
VDTATYTSAHFFKCVTEAATELFGPRGRGARRFRGAVPGPKAPIELGTTAPASYAATQPTHRGKPESRPSVSFYPCPVPVRPCSSSSNLLYAAFYLLVHNMTHDEYEPAKRRLEEIPPCRPRRRRRNASGGPGAR